MPRPKTISGTKTIKFRVPEKLYIFITELSKRLGTSKSEICRTALLDYFMALFLGRVKDVEKEFYARYSNYFKEKVKNV